MTHFARALGVAHEKRFTDAKKEIEILEQIRERVAKSNQYWAKQVEVQSLAAQGWLEYLSGDTTKGVATMKRSADLEATTEKSAVSPGEVLPAAELYGDMLMREKRYGEAIVAYTAALKRSPRRFNSLFGVARAHELTGNVAAARDSYAELIAMCTKAGDNRTKLVNARKYLTTN